MECLNEFRGSGKTTKIIEWCKQDKNHIMIVSNEVIQFNLYNLFPTLKFHNQIDTWKNFLTGSYYGKHDLKFYIDNIDNCLNYNLHYSNEVVGISLTKEKKEFDVKTKIKFVKELT